MMLTAGCTHTVVHDLNVTDAPVSVGSDPRITHQPATTSPPSTVAVQQLSCPWLIPGDGSIPLGSYQVNVQLCVWAAPPDAATAATTAAISKRGGHVTKDTLVPMCFNQISSPIVLTAPKPTPSPSDDSWWTSVRNLPIIIAVPVSIVVCYRAASTMGRARQCVVNSMCMCASNSVDHFTGIGVRRLADLVVHATVAIPLATNCR